MATDKSVEESSRDNEIPVALTHPIQQARKHDQERIMHANVDGKPNAFRAAVCVLCDRLIIGCESIHKISAESLRSQRNRISIKSNEDYHEVDLKDKHISQYQIRGHELEGLLLHISPSHGDQDHQMMIMIILVTITRQHKSHNNARMGNY